MHSHKGNKINTNRTKKKRKKNWKISLLVINFITAISIIIKLNFHQLLNPNRHIGFWIPIAFSFVNFLLYCTFWSTSTKNNYSFWSISIKKNHNFKHSFLLIIWHYFKVKIILLSCHKRLTLNKNYGLSNLAFFQTLLLIKF